MPEKSPGEIALFELSKVSCSRCIVGRERNWFCLHMKEAERVAETANGIAVRTTTSTTSNCELRRTKRRNGRKPSRWMSRECSASASWPISFTCSSSEGPRDDCSSIAARWTTYFHEKSNCGESILLLLSSELRTKASKLGRFVTRTKHQETGEDESETCAKWVECYQVAAAGNPTWTWIARRNKSSSFLVKIHGLRKCGICQVFLNRDVNAAVNIRQRFVNWRLTVSTLPKPQQQAFSRSADVDSESDTDF